MRTISIFATQKCSCLWLPRDSELGFKPRKVERSFRTPFSSPPKPFDQLKCAQLCLKPFSLSWRGYHCFATNMDWNDDRLKLSQVWAKTNAGTSSCHDPNSDRFLCPGAYCKTWGLWCFVKNGNAVACLPSILRLTKLQMNQDGAILTKFTELQMIIVY